MSNEEFKFLYNDLVTITAGFYKGSVGRIVRYHNNSIQSIGKKLRKVRSYDLELLDGRAIELISEEIIENRDVE